MFLHQCEGVDPLPDLLDGQQVPLQDDQGGGHQFDVCHRLTVVQVLQNNKYRQHLPLDGEGLQAVSTRGI